MRQELAIVLLAGLMLGGGCNSDIQPRSDVESADGSPSERLVIFAHAGEIEPMSNLPQDDGYDYRDLQWDSFEADLVVTFSPEHCFWAFESFEEVECIANGESLGMGEAGFSRLAEKIRCLPKTSCVFVYPAVDDIDGNPPPRMEWVRPTFDALARNCLQAGVTAVFAHSGPTQPFQSPYGTLCAYGEERRLSSITTKPDMLLTWRGYTKDYGISATAEYFLNGQSMGRGMRGIRKAAHEIRHFPAGSHLVIYPADFAPEMRYVWNRHAPYMGAEYPLIAAITSRKLKLTLVDETSENEESTFAEKFYGNSWISFRRSVDRSELAGRRTSRQSFETVSRRARRGISR